MSLDEVIKELEQSDYEGGGWMLVGESLLEITIHYLKQYRDKQRLIDTLRKDLMNERKMYAEALKGVK